VVGLVRVLENLRIHSGGWWTGVWAKAAKPAGAAQLRGGETRIFHLGRHGSQRESTEEERL
jgi:hypothetical protein